MKRYDSYKNSGVEWIGEIPTNWDFVRGKFIFQNKKEINKENQELNLLSLTYNGVLNKDIKSNEGLRPTEYSSYQVFEKNDLVFKLIDLENQKTSRVGLVHERGIMSPVYIRLESKNTIDSKYSYYYYYNLYKQYIFNFLGSGVRSSLTPSNLLEIELPLPPISEQQQIVSFLDTKTSLIDSLIEKTQRKIELLKEKRTSLINEVVTKGLNPNVEMKDSSVEWIGEIPIHWGVSKLGFLSKPVQGIQVDVENQLYNQYEGSERFIRISDYTMEEEPRYVDSYPESSIVNEEDLVMVRYGSKSGKVYSGIKGVICNNVFRIEHNEKLYTRFLFYFLNQESFYNQIEMSRDNNTLPQVSHGLYKEMKITLPIIQEQQQIVEYLDEQTQLIDKTISIEEKRIELLKEYRQSLISEVVTGKRKVVE